MNWQIFGIIAGGFTSFGFLPQIVKGYKSRHLNDLSYLTNSLLGIGMGMWLIYGIATKDLPVIIANILGVAFNAALILMKYFYSRKH